MIRGEPKTKCIDCGEPRGITENRGEIAGGLFYFCKMKFSNESILISVDSLLEDKMRIINREKVLLDFELAELLQVSTQDLIRKVRANKDRFPSDFLIKLSAKKYLPSEKRRKVIYAFTLGGIMMAAGWFNTDRANQISIQMVEFICKRGLGMEEILALFEKVTR